MNRANLYPYLVLDPAAEAICLAVGHGLFAQLFEDREAAVDLVHDTIDPDQLREARLTAPESHRIALDNLIRFADDSPALSIQVLGNPGDAIHFLLYSDHPRASSCLLLPDLYEHASDLLHAAELLACVPQRDSLVIFPKRDRAYREAVLSKLREIEADAPLPLTFELFKVLPGGVKPFYERE